MRIEADQPCPLPDDPMLAEWAIAMRDTGQWGWIVDSSWHTRFITDEFRLSSAADTEMCPIVLDVHLFGPHTIEMATRWRTGLIELESWRGFFANVGGLVLADTGGGKPELRSVVDPSLADLVEEPTPAHVISRPEPCRRRERAIGARTSSR